MLFRPPCTANCSENRPPGKMDRRPALRGVVSRRRAQATTCFILHHFRPPISALPGGWIVQTANAGKVGENGPSSASFPQWGVEPCRRGKPHTGRHRRQRWGEHREPPRTSVTALCGMCCWFRWAAPDRGLHLRRCSPASPQSTAFRGACLPCSTAHSVLRTVPDGGLLRRVPSPLHARPRASSSG